MLKTKINFKCDIPECGSISFYVMPIDEKVKSGDLISSPNKFLVKCKNCKQKYLLEFNIKRI